MCITKQYKFNKLFKQESFIQYFNQRFEIETLFNLLNEDEIDKLLNFNVVFIRCYSPSAKVDLKGLQIDGKLTLISFDANYYSYLMPDEFVAIILHEIGHVFNPDVQDIEGEYAADSFATRKGYAKWIISGLKKGMKKKWIGFEVDKCQPRIDRLCN